MKRSWLPPTAFRYPELVHVGSYFLALRRPVLDDPGFRRRLDAVVPQRDRGQPGAEVRDRHHAVPRRPGLRLLDLGAATCGPTTRSTGPASSTCSPTGFPLFKRRFLVANPYDTPDLADWKQRILAVVPDAPVDVFERNLLRVADPDELARSFALRSSG